MPAPAPSAASPRGITQHEEAISAPRPATKPNAANHLGAAGATEGDVADGSVSCEALSLWHGFALC